MNTKINKNNEQIYWFLLNISGACPSPEKSRNVKALPYDEEKITQLKNSIIRVFNRTGLKENPKEGNNSIIGEVNLPDGKTPFDRAVAQNDIVDNAVFKLGKILASDKNLVWDMQWIGEIADLVEDYLLKEGVPICRPWFEGDSSDTPCYTLKNKENPNRFACGRVQCPCLLQKKN